MIGIGSTIPRLAVTGGTALSAYAVGNFEPALVFDFGEEYYRTGGSASTFSDSITHSRLGNATMVDSDGVPKWAPHNLLTYSEQFDNAIWVKTDATVTSDTVAAPNTTDTADTIEFTSIGASNVQSVATNLDTAASHTFGVWLKTASGTLDVRIGNINAGVYEIKTITSEWQLFTVEQVPSATSRFPRILADASSSGTFYAWGAHLYRSDLGGMVNNPDRGDSYVPTTSSAVHLPRRGHHVWNGSAWVNEGLLHESEARTQLLHTTNALVTQSHTVTAVPHTLHFTGTGTVTLSGASTAGPLVGTGTGEENRVSLTFTPTAASLTLTVSGTVTDAQLEVGSTPSSYIPNLAGSGTVTSAADSDESDNLTYDSAAMWFSLSGLETYADEGTVGQVTLFNWEADANNKITVTLDTDGVETGEITLTVVSGGTTWSVAADYLSPGINQPFNIAWRVTSSDINIAVGGAAQTAVSTTSIPDLSSATAAFEGMGVRSLFRQGTGNLPDAGLEEASQ